MKFYHKATYGLADLWAYIESAKPVKYIMITVYDAIGLLGVALSVGSYARVQWRRDYAKKMSYSVVNLASVLLVYVSIFHNWNLAACVSNSLWGMISIYGIRRCIKHAKRARS